MNLDEKALRLDLDLLQEELREIEALAKGLAARGTIEIEGDLGQRVGDSHRFGDAVDVRARKRRLFALLSDPASIAKPGGGRLGVGFADDARKNPARRKAEGLAGHGDGLDLGLGRIGQRVAVEREFDRFGTVRTRRPSAQLRAEARPAQPGKRPVESATLSAEASGRLIRTASTP